MRLIECARRAGVTADTLRHYLRIGLVEADSRADNGYRTFSERTVARVRFVRSAMSLGFALKDAAELVEMSRRGTSPCPRARELLDERLEDQERHLHEAEHLLRRMKHAVSDWRRRPNGVPDGHSICVLIEGTASPSDHAEQSEMHDRK